MEDGYPISDVIRFHRELDQFNWQLGGEKMRYNFLRRTEFLPHAILYRKGEISRLETAFRRDVAQFQIESQEGRMTLDLYVQTAPVNGMLILHHGHIVYETYPRMRPFDKHLYMSVSKTYVAAVIAILEERGLLEVRQPVDSYLPEVYGSGWEGVPVQDALDMASGIDATENEEGYTNPDAPYYQYEASLGWLPATERTLPSTYSYVATLKRKEPPGQVFDYSSTNTFLLSWLAERLTGMPMNEILTDEIWGKIGAEADGLLAISPFGAPGTSGGIFGTLRDLARFGLLFTQGGRETLAESVLPDGYLQKIQLNGRPEIFDKGAAGQNTLRMLHGERPRHNTWQWDYVMEDGDFFKGGYGGQGLYISPHRDLVIAYFGTPFDENLQSHELEWITRQMVKAGLFD
jgi:CubicO group peptidase (beta-lactamase class C family)